MITNLLPSKAYGCFTLMGMTDATSDPVLCICILADKSLNVTDVKVFYYRAYIPYDSSKTTEENMGKGKSLPGFPVCKFRGKLIPSLMCIPPQRINQLRYPNWSAQVLGSSQCLWTAPRWSNPILIIGRPHKYTPVTVPGINQLHNTWWTKEMDLHPRKY